MHKFLHYLSTRFPMRSFEQHSLEVIRETGFRHINSVILCLLSICIIGVYTFFNLATGNFTILPVLGLSAIMPCLCLLWLRRREDATLPMLCLGLNLLVMAVCTLMFHSSQDGGSLLWHLIFPPLVIFCMGLRLGAVIWGMYFICLILIMYSPLQYYMNYQYPEAFRDRFMIANLLEFTAFWLLEYVRVEAYKALLSNLDRMSRYAYTDLLTGLGNRRDFQNHLNWVRAQAKRTGGGFSVALADLDHFKTVNDTYGHQVGDLVLKHCAETISASMRETDRLFRWGGEEFILLMPNTAPASATSVAERVRANLQATPYVHGDSVIPLTISLGVDSWDAAGDLDALLRNVDARLYLAKRQGRNKVCGRQPECAAGQGKELDGLKPILGAAFLRGKMRESAGPQSRFPED